MSAPSYQLSRIVCAAHITHLTPLIRHSRHSALYKLPTNEQKVSIHIEVKVVGCRVSLNSQKNGNL